MNYWEIVQQRSFHLMEPHVRLVRRLSFHYDDNSPQIDSYRPYGNSDVTRDIAEILGDPLLQPDDDEGEGFTKEQEDVLMQWHSEVTLALQVIADTGKLEPGYYFRASCSAPWIPFTRDEFKNPDPVRERIYFDKSYRQEREQDMKQVPSNTFYTREAVFAMLQGYIETLPDDGYDHFEPIHSFLYRAERERDGR